MKKVLKITVYDNGDIKVKDKHGQQINGVNSPDPDTSGSQWAYEAKIFRENPTCIWYRGKRYCR